MTRSILLVLATSAIFSAAISAAESPLRVIKDASDQPIAIEASGWTKDWLTAFTKSETYMVEYVRPRLGIYVVDEKGETSPQPISGNYELRNGAVRFTPQFSLRPGMAYKAIFCAPVGSRQQSVPDIYTANITIPTPPPAPPTRVTAIYPSASTLPENQLRFYIYFSAPMASSDAYSHVKLVKANGQVIDRAFLEASGELWDGSGQRLTVLCDPGRVKKGLQPRKELGPVLEAGHSYRLVVDTGLRDASGQPLAAEFEKKFVAGPAVESAIDIKAWKITAPAAGARDPLVLQFPRPLDRALLMRMLTVAGAGGKPIDGQITIGDEERRWEFRPTQIWPAGQFNLVADTALEDSAGNNVARAFEVDVFDRVDEKPGPNFVKIPFTIAKK
jgi:hypothetical protein